MSFLIGGSGQKAQATPPQYTGLQIQTATNTLPIPIVMGRTKLAPNLLWADDFKAIPHTESQSGGGKGGGGGSTSSTSYTYSISVIMGLCEGPIAGVTTVWASQTITDLSSLGFTLFPGSATQDPWGYLASAHPDAAMAYPGTAYTAQANYDMGSSNSLPNHNYEVYGLLSGTGINERGDADPSACAIALLTDPGYGAGFPLDSLYLPSWSSGGAATSSGDASWQSYCRAMSLDFSPCLKDSETASTLLDRWLQITNSAAVWSAGQLKIIPYGLAETGGNGYVYNPNVTPVYDLSDRDFIRADNADPVQFAVLDPADISNCYRVEFSDSANAYNLGTAETKDQNLIELYGLRPAATITAHEITTARVAMIVANLIKQRAVTTTLTYSFQLSWEYCLLEPMDLVTLTDPGLGLDKTPARITAIAEDEDGLLSITAENVPAGVVASTAYPYQGASPTPPAGGSGTTTPPVTPPVYPSQAVTNTPVNTGVAPAPVNPPVIFEPGASLTGGVAQVWIAASGGAAGVADPQWGGCRVYVSVDGVAYQKIGSITAPARMGLLTAALPAFAGTNPDAANTLAVSLAESGGALLSGSDADAAAGRTLCCCGGELLSYTTATLRGANVYALSGLYRGQNGTAAAAHILGAAFARLDDAVFHYDLPASYIGQTMHLKLPSFNVFGNAEQSLADCVDYVYTPTGIAKPAVVTPATPAAPIGIGGDQANQLTWVPPAEGVTTNVYAFVGSGAGAGFAAASLIAHGVTGPSYIQLGLGSSQSVTYWITQTSAGGTSGPSAPVAVTTTPQPYDIAGSLAGLPTAGQILFRLEMVRAVALPAGLAGSKAICQTAPTAAVTLPIKKNGSAIGGIVFAAGATAGVFSFAAPVALAPGDILELDAPATLDTTFAGPSYTIIGTR